MNAPAELLLSGRRIARNALWNFAGLTVPLLVAMVTVPYLIGGLGKERFGLLAIIWMGIGYFSLFDMGVGRALTKLVAEHLGRKKPESIQEVIWTALWMIFGLSVVAMLGLYAASPSLMTHVLNVPLHIKGESLTAFRILAFGLPVVILTSSFVGILEAHQRFAGIAALRALLGAFTFLAPILTLQVSQSLAAATGALLAVRVVAFLAYFVMASKVHPELLRPQRPGRTWVMPLFSFGGWLTVTNIVGPVMVYFDRFFIASLLSLHAVAYYVTPYEVVARIFILPQAIMGVLYPALATAYIADRKRMVALYGQASRVILLVTLPPVTLIFFFAPEGLTLWLGDNFREASTSVARWLAVGVIVNSLARAPLVALQSTGRPDLVAKIHLAQLLPYVGLLWMFTLEFGIAGTAAVWTIRIVADTVLLLWLARGAIPELRALNSRAYIVILVMLVAFSLGALLEQLNARVLIVLGVSVACGILLWPSLRRLGVRP